MATHYSVLGVANTASLSEIKAAHRRLARRSHPDKRTHSGTLEIRNNRQSVSKAIPTAGGGEKNVLVDTLIGDRTDSCAIGSSTQDTSAFDTGNEADADADADGNFRRIQMAWECLRDPTKRKNYDDELARKYESALSKVNKAVVIRLSEMDCEVCEVENDRNEEDDLSDAAGTSNRAENHSNNIGEDNQVQRVYVHKCRCGEDFEIFEDELGLVEGTDSVDSSCGIENVFECQSCCLLIRVVVDVPLGGVVSE